MRCPRCETTALEERDRDGVTVDVCRSCRGIWLDRGELEKLIARTTADLDAYERRPETYERRPESYERRPDTGHYARDDDYRRRHPRKKTWVESLGDIFD